MNFTSKMGVERNLVGSKIAPTIFKLVILKILTFESLLESQYYMLLIY